MIDAAGTMLTDIPCVACGFSLKGLPNRGRCPECGKPIRSSTRASRLCLRRPAWWDQTLRFIVMAGGLASPLLLFLGLMLGQQVVLQVCVRVSQTAFFTAMLGTCVSYHVRHSWAVRLFAIAALACGVLASLLA